MKIPLYYYLVIFFFSLLSNLTQANDIVLTEKEKQWLKDHPQIRVASDTEFPPIEWLDEHNQLQGIAIDYLKEIEKKLPVNFIQIKKKNWSDIIQGVKNHKVDLLSAVAKNKNREEYLIFTKAYLSFPAVIISSQNYQHLEELRGKKVGVVKDSYWDDLLTQGGYDVQIVRVESGADGIKKASIGFIDAMISNLATVSYAVKQMGISNLNIVHVPRHEHRVLELSIGIRKDWPELQGILQKVIDHISQKEKDDIYNRWIKLETVSFWQSPQFWYPVIIITCIIIIVIAAILFWNHSLKKRVKERTEELEKAQKQLIHAEKMESIGRLSAGVAHEVKNPLAILQMSIDYLKGEDNDETIQTILNDMEDAVNRADTVIKGLLDFSREKELQVQCDDLNDVINHSMHLIEHEIRQNNIHLELKLQSDLPPILMDKNRLQQVFINLFMNAIQAMISRRQQGKENLQLQVISKTLEVSDPDLINIEMNNNDWHYKKGQTLVQVIIRDTGTGLDKQHENIVFEPFFTTKPQGEGTGLGLSVSKTIIGLHHGMIHMQNRFDGVQGAEVLMIFPAHKEKKKSFEKKAE